MQEQKECGDEQDIDWHSIDPMLGGKCGQAIGPIGGPHSEGTQAPSVKDCFRTLEVVLERLDDVLVRLDNLEEFLDTIELIES